MILESRSIIFSDEELIIAFQNAIQEKAGDANAMPVGVMSDLDQQGEVTVRFKLGDGKILGFDANEVGPIILNHCIEVGIPLPRGSYKELAVRGDHVAMIVRLETGMALNGEEAEEF